MRVSGGRARGIPLRAPRGDIARPATDALRQAVFSSLGGRVAGAQFLDLFAGTGAYGLEALSRGAAGGVFVEKDREAVACLRKNIAAVCKSLGRGEQGLDVFPGDAVNPPLEGGTLPDLVFIDPPYEMVTGVAPLLFPRLGQALAANSDVLIVFELPGELDLAPEGWTMIKRIGKGRRQPTAAFYRKS